MVHLLLIDRKYRKYKFQLTAGSHLVGVFTILWTSWPLLSKVIEPVSVRHFHFAISICHMTYLCVWGRVCVLLLLRLAPGHRTSPELNDSDSCLVWSQALRVKTEGVLTLDAGSLEREGGGGEATWTRWVTESVTMAIWTRSLSPPQSFISSFIEFVDVVCYSAGNSMCSMAKRPHSHVCLRTYNLVRPQRMDFPSLCSKKSLV